MKEISTGKVLVVALCLGVLTSGLVYKYLSAQAREARAEVQVVVARRDIARGTPVDVNMLDTRQFPRSDLAAPAATSPEMVVGKVAVAAIKAGEPIPLDSIVPRNRLSYVVPPFMRAVTVGLDPVTGVGGFIKPGDRVDVVATFSLNGGTVTKIVLQNVELLATGSEVVSEGVDRHSGKAVSPTVQPTATLAVMPGDAQRLILADSKGKLRLMLRRSDDRSFFRAKAVSGRAVIGTVPPDVPEQRSGAGSAVPAARASLQVAPFPVLPQAVGAGIRVQVIRGTEVEDVFVAE